MCNENGDSSVNIQWCKLSIIRILKLNDSFDYFDKDLTKDKSENDLVTLGELTEYENTVWQFPDVKRCPLRSCGRGFSTRSQTIEHYRETHAKHAVLCRICNYPLMLLTAAHHLDGHFLRKHPTETPPLKVKIQRVNETIWFNAMIYSLFNFVSILISIDFVSMNVLFVT